MVLSHCTLHICLFLLLGLRGVGTRSQRHLCFTFFYVLAKQLAHNSCPLNIQILLIDCLVEGKKKKWERLQAGESPNYPSVSLYPTSRSLSGSGPSPTGETWLMSFLCLRVLVPRLMKSESLGDTWVRNGPYCCLALINLKIILYCSNGNWLIKSGCLEMIDGKSEDFLIN